MKSCIIGVLLLILCGCAPTNQEYQLMKEMPLGSFVVSKLEENKIYLVIDYRSTPDGYVAVCKDRSDELKTFRIVEIKPAPGQSPASSTSEIISPTTTTSIVIKTVRKQYIEEF